MARGLLREADSEEKIIEPLERVYGVDFSDEKLLAAIEQHNELCSIITEMGELRKAETR